ncbi:MAG: hypothetical protein ABFD59_01190 [Smithella sp.]|jgi:hypothetical protein
MVLRRSKPGHARKKPGEKGEFRKLTYVEVIAGTNYFIGAGAYVP